MENDATAEKLEILRKKFYIQFEIIGQIEATYKMHPEKYRGLLPLMWVLNTHVEEAEDCLRDLWSQLKEQEEAWNTRDLQTASS